MSDEIKLTKIGRIVIDEKGISIAGFEVNRVVAGLNEETTTKVAAVVFAREVLQRMIDELLLPGLEWDVTATIGRGET